MESKCTKCGGNKSTPGKLNAMGGVTFTPDDLKFWILKSSLVHVQASMCLECGFIELIGDIEKAEDLMESKNV